MEVSCKHGRDIWPVKIHPLEINKETYYEVRVSARGSDFHVIVGSYTYGRYLCVPNWDFGCALSGLNDRFWNEERIRGHIRKVDAATLACAISHLEEL
jgi:hypothetical protein